MFEQTSSEILLRALIMRTESSTDKCSVGNLYTLIPFGILNLKHNLVINFYFLLSRIKKMDIFVIPTIPGFSKFPT